MKRILISTLILLVVTAAVWAQGKVSSKQQSWDLGNNLSLAALYNSTSGEAAVARKKFAAAETNAKSLGITLPALPTTTHDNIKDKAEALFYLLNSTGKPIMEILAEDFGTEHAALFEISFKTNILLMLYDPEGGETAAIVGVIRKRTPDAGLPPVVFEELIDLIGRKAGFEEVEKEIFILQRIVSPFVASGEFSVNGVVFYEKGEYAESIAEFSEAIKIIPDEPEFYFLRARSYLQDGKYKEAIADYTKVIQFAASENEKTNLPLVYHNRGLCYGLLKNYAPALADLSTAIRLDPEYASAYKIRSLVYREAGKKALADADYRKAESLRPGIMN
jgi:tetratricopeptide (TPR) repeat protein